MFIYRNDFPHPLRNISFESLRTALFSEQIGVCRICLEETDRRKLLRPCKCRGTQAYVHKQCLERWLIDKRDRMCETCLSEYEMEYRGLKPFNMWMWPRPASDRWDDQADFASCFIWLIIASRVCYCWFISGIPEFHRGLYILLRSRKLVAFWWFSFFVNTVYYPSVVSDICRRWWNENTVYSWRKDSLAIGEDNNQEER